MDQRFDLRRYFAQCGQALNQVDPAEVQALALDLCDAFDRGATIFLCGNGGSGSNASHICQDLGKSTLSDDAIENGTVSRLKIVSLTDNVPYILAWANDFGYERIFVEQLKNLAACGDRLIALSGSGNSPNVLRAVEWANDHDLVTWGITGFGGGELLSLAQHSLHVPSDDMGVVECTHLLIFHWVLAELKSHMTGDGARAEPVSPRETAACGD